MAVTSRREIRVLHVDDDPDFADLTKTALEREDDWFTVETATSADDGLERLDDGRPDCIVSDYNMPGTNGIEFLQAVRERFHDLPFVLFTGKGSEAVASDAIAAGVTDYLQKGSGTGQYELLANRVRNAVRAQSEGERADRKDELMRLTEIAGDTGGFELDLDSGSVLLTDGTRRLVGLPEDTHISFEEGVELYHPDDRADVRETVTRAAETGEQTRGTWRLQPLDGDERLVEVTVTPATEDDDVDTLRGAVHDITERRKRRRELEQIETLFRNAQDGLCLLNVDDGFTVERVNPAYEQIRGLSAEQVRGKPLRDVLGERAGAVAESQCRECVEREESVEVERTLQREGEQAHYVTRLSPVVVDGAVEHVACSIRNVTTQRERQQELRLLEQFIDNADVPITLADPSREDDPLVYVNDGFEAMTGYSPEETLGRNCRFLQGEDTDPETVAALREAIDNEERTSVELRNYRKDGTEFWNRLTVTPIYDDAGDLVRYLGTQQDVTERKEREAKLRETTKQLQDIIDTVESAMWIRNADGEYVYMNQYHRDLFDIAADTDVAGKGYGDLLPAEVAEQFRQNDQRVYETNERIEVEETVRTEDGPRDYLTRIHPLFDDDEVYAICGIATDITEQKTREQRLDEFASIVSHDLRNPLQVARGQLEVIRADVDHDGCETLMWAHDRMETLIDDLLTLARQGEVCSDLERTSLSSVVDDCWTVVDSEDATVTVETDLTLLADSDRLQQLLGNLFRNAIEHGGDTVTIRVGPLPDGAGFYVADDGPGIPDDERDDVFEFGYSTTASGTGFGLAIVEEIADAHKWSIDVTESVDQGARFEVNGVTTGE